MRRDKINFSIIVTINPELNTKYDFSAPLIFVVEKGTIEETEKVIPEGSIIILKQDMKKLFWNQYLLPLQVINVNLTLYDLNKVIEIMVGHAHKELKTQFKKHHNIQRKVAQKEETNKRFVIQNQNTGEYVRNYKGYADAWDKGSFTSDITKARIYKTEAATRPMINSFRSLNLKVIEKTMTYNLV